MLAGRANGKRETDHPVITTPHTHPGDPVTPTSRGCYFARAHTYTHTHKVGLSETRVCFYYLPQTDPTLCLRSPFVFIARGGLLHALFYLFFFFFLDSHKTQITQVLFRKNDYFTICFCLLANSKHLLFNHIESGKLVTEIFCASELLSCSDSRCSL